MTPDHKKTAFTQKNPYPTSPWTEAYHEAPSHFEEESTSTAAAQQPQSPATSDDLRPTHDALSLIYNRGY